MHDAISKIQANYAPLEDRILLNITTLNQHVYALWITRRYLKLLIPALQGKHPRTLDPLLSDNEMALLHLSDIETLLETDRPDQDSDDESIDLETRYPLGESPVLLTKISFTEMDSEHPFIELNPESGSGLALPYEAYVLRILFDVIQPALHKSHWEISVDESMSQPAQYQLH